MNFKISFWNLPVSKDDSFIGLPEAELIHAAVSSDEGKQARRYVVEPISQVWKENIGTVELQRTADNHWNLVRGNDLVEGVFPRIVLAIEEVESQMTGNDGETEE